LTLGASAITVTGILAWDCSTDTNMTFTPGTSTITLSGAGAYFQVGSTPGSRAGVYNNVVFTGSGNHLINRG
jgi:hypothetical protein